MKGIKEEAECLMADIDEGVWLDQRDIENRAAQQARRIIVLFDALEKIDRKLCTTLDLGIWSVPSVEVRESLELIRQALKQAGEE